jgi:hypothetical protein
MATITQDQLGPVRSATLNPPAQGTPVGAEEFRGLLLSRRRLVRLDWRESGLRGLRDLDSGELFYTEERRLVDA